MPATAEQGGAPSSETTSILSPEQMRQIITFLSGATRKPEPKEPKVYQGEQHKLLECLAQLTVDYRPVGWQNGHVEERILYATSLLPDDADPGSHLTQKNESPQHGTIGQGSKQDYKANLT